MVNLWAGNASSGDTVCFSHSSLPSYSFHPVPSILFLPSYSFHPTSNWYLCVFLSPSPFQSICSIVLFTGHTHAHTQTQTYTHTHTHARTRTQRCAHMHTLIYTHPRVHYGTHSHTHAHTHKLMAVIMTLCVSSPPPGVVWRGAREAAGVTRRGEEGETSCWEGPPSAARISIHCGVIVVLF